MPQSPTPAPVSRLDELSAKATPGPWITGGFIRINDRSREVATRDFIVALVNAYRSGALAPSDQTERERVIEECAQVVDEAADCVDPGPAQDDLRTIAGVIRALATAERSGAPASEWIVDSPRERATLDALREASLALNGGLNTQGLHSQIEAALRAYEMPGFVGDRPLPAPPSPSSTAGGRS